MMYGVTNGSTQFLWSWTSPAPMVVPPVPYVYPLAGHDPSSIPSQVQALPTQQPPMHNYGARALIPTYAHAIPHAFRTMTLQNLNWNIDMGASSHLADNTCILTSFSNSSTYSSVFVGN
nr:ribonuclease H-like domain-containing protein [Tanacetum cinerariifolium]